ncbi:MAG: M2 family metallopeptidase [Bacteroidota bacterium]
MKRNIISKAVLILFATSIVVGCGESKKKTMDQDLTDFIKTFEGKYIPLFKESNIAYFDATTTGKDEFFKKSEDAQNKIVTILSNKDDFKKLKEFKESGKIENDTLKRQLEVLYNMFLSNQVEPSKLNAIIALETQVEKKYSTFRADVQGVAKELTDNQIEEVLRTSNNSKELEATWIASKQVGKMIEPDIRKLVKMRNEIARELGYKNYHEMSLKLGEQDPAEIEKLFDELDNLTRDSFVKLKNEIDANLTARYKVKKEELRPWHYQNRFFQEAPKIYQVDLDKYYKGKDLVEITTRYFKSIGLPIEDMVKKSDLFEKPGKNQHAYCTDIDNEGDVRVLCNVKDNSYWMNTMLHEFGHAVYDKNIDRKLPFILRDPAHTFTTEAIAMIFGRMSNNAQWMQDLLGINEQEAKKIAEESYKVLRLEQLVFSRWSQVMYRFEKLMYENPDQDLNKLWWDLVEKYQLLTRPENRNEPDWASKIHIATSPCYYHNYLMGELLASQLHNYITVNIIKSEDSRGQSFYNKADVGKYLTEKIFSPGSLFTWNAMIEKATGEKLTAKYYAKQFVD